MKRKTGLVFVIGALVNLACVTCSGRQASDVNSLLRLEDYLRFAALNNAGLKASFELWKAAIEQIPQAKSLPDPRFNYGYFIQEVETRVGPQRQRFEIMQVFPWFGTIEARTDQAAAKARAAYNRYEAEKLRLFRDVKYAFYEYSYLARTIEITRENLGIIKHFEEVARIRYAAAATSHPDIIRAQIELAIVEDRLKSVEQLRPAITARLNSILNRDASAELPWPQSPAYQEVTLSFGQLYKTMLKNNPGLEALDNEVEAAQHSKTLARKKFYPEIGLGISYIDTAHARMSGMEDSGKDPIMAMLSINLPIWTGNYKAAEQQAEAQARQKMHEKQQAEYDLAAKARQVLYDFEDSQRKIRLYRDVIILKTKETLSASETAYQAGKIDFLSLLDSQRMLLQYGLYCERIVAENAQKLAELEMLAGVQLPMAQKDSAMP